MAPWFLQFATAWHAAAWRETLKGCNLKWVRGSPHFSVALSGLAIFERHAELIKAAQSEICLQTFVWRTDTKEEPCEPAQIILHALKKLDETGRAVKVYLLLDQHKLGWFGGDAAGNAMKSIAKLALTNIHVYARNYEHTDRNALHSKSLVVDGKCALLTGANVQPFYNSDRSWFDGAYQFDGGIATELRAEFEQAWCLAGGKKLPILSGTSQSGTFGVGGMPAQEFQCALLGRPSSHIMGWSNDCAQCKGILTILAAAKSCIRIHTPNLNAKPVMAALIEAVHRGVTVKLVLSKGFNDFNEHRIDGGGSNAYCIDRMREALSSDECQRFDVRWYANPKGTTIDDNLDKDRKFASHAKYLSVDSQVVVVGSANLDNQSWYFSREVNVLVNAAPVAMAWDYLFFTPSFERATPVKDN